MSSYNGPKLIIALDNIEEEIAVDIIERLKDFSGKIVFKVSDLLFEIGARGISEILLEKDSQAMIDSKWLDISETDLNYLRKLAKYPDLAKRTEFLTVHASNGVTALTKLMEEKQKLGLSTKIYAVTALTSLADEDTQPIFDETSKHSVLKLAKEALEAGIDGIVCSPLEAQVLREVYGKKYNFEIITPGVRFEGNDKGDQKRVTTPADAIRNGSTHIVMGRDILKSDDVFGAVQRFFNEIAGVVPTITENYQFEKLLYTGEWLELLKYIGAIYRRPEGGDYVRLASGLISDTYINIGATERNYLVLERVGKELTEQLHKRGMNADTIMGAQMGSIRISSYLAEKMGIEESIYTEKTGDGDKEMALKRHDVSLQGKKVILSEDIITKGSTLEKMIAIVKEKGGEVVAITCVGNRYGDTEFMGIPLISCFTPPEFNMWWDEKTPSNNRGNYSQLPDNSRISEKPKNDWNRLVLIMRQ